MSVYLDASVLVAMFMAEQSTSRADRFLRSTSQVLVVSDLAAAEFSSALARRVRMGELISERARVAFAGFDAWISSTTQRLETSGADLRTAEAFIRRLDLPLRTPDAMNIAIARRAEASLATFDEKMRRAAEVLGVRAEPI